MWVSKTHEWQQPSVNMKLIVLAVLQMWHTLAQAVLLLALMLDGISEYFDCIHFF